MQSWEEEFSIVFRYLVFAFYSLVFSASADSWLRAYWWLFCFAFSFIFLIQF